MFKKGLNKKFTTDLTRVDPDKLDAAQKSINILNQCSAFHFELVAKVCEGKPHDKPYAISNSLDAPIAISLWGHPRGDVVRFEHACDSDHDIISVVLRGFQHMFLDPTSYVQIRFSSRGVHVLRRNVNHHNCASVSVTKIEDGYNVKSSFSDIPLFQGSSEEVIKELQENVSQRYGRPWFYF